MQAEIVTLAQLLGGGFSQYVVPSFQRNYIWAEEHFKYFWEGIENIFNSDEKTKNNFFGTIIVQPITLELVNLRRYLLIDGQQRLVTFMVLLAALERKSADFDNNATDSIRQLLYVSRIISSSDEQRLKIIVTPKDQEAINLVIKGEWGNPQSAMEKAYGYFLNKIGSLANNHMSFINLLDIVFNN